MIALAKELNIPLIVHSRKAEKEACEMLISNNARKVVIHCFNGKLSLAKEMEAKGFFFSIPAIISHASQFKELVKAVNSTHLLTETDAPFLSAVKGERNEPSAVKEIVDEISEIKRVEAEEMAKIIFSNYQKLFMQ